MSIGGNTWGLFQCKNTNAKNAIGEAVPSWVDALSVTGWLDLSSGDSKHTVFNAKIQESTHIFLCDYQPLMNNMSIELDGPITSENARMVIDGLIYEILLIDDPMNMHEHFEIYLKFIGGQGHVCRI